MWLAIRGAVELKAWTIAALCLISVSAAAQDSVRQASAPASRVVGHVTDSAGTRLSGAEVSVFQTQLRLVTDDSGAFDMSDIPSGITVFSVRRLGYEAATFTAVLKPGKAHRVTFVLTEIAQSLAGVTVQEKASPSSWLSLFEKRRTNNRGTFITRKDIERRQARTASDILRTVAGVSVANTRLGPQLMMTRGAGARRCFPQLYVHTTPYSGMIDDFAADDVEAIEVYNGISEIPPDLNTLGRPVCAAVVIWTREPPPRKKGA
jgi:hypothetical protein